MNYLAEDHGGEFLREPRMREQRRAAVREPVNIAKNTDRSRIDESENSQLNFEPVSYFKGLKSCLEQPAFSPLLNKSSRRIIFGSSFLILFLSLLISFERTSNAYVTAIATDEISSDLTSAAELEAVLRDFIEETPEQSEVGELTLENMKSEEVISEDISAVVGPRKNESFNQNVVESTEASYKNSTKEHQTFFHHGMVQFIAGVVAVYLPEIPNAGAIASEVVAAAIREDVDPLFVAAVISVESRFSVKAKSKVGAQGLMQLMPQTAKEITEKIMGKKVNLSLTEPKTNILLGIYYLKYLQGKYRGNRRLALAAYNWGPANVDKAIRGEIRIPLSVQKYAQTILIRSSRWNKHYYLASREAAQIIAPQSLG